MTKKELLEQLEQVDDDVIIYVETEEEIYHNTKCNRYCNR